MRKTATRHLDPGTPPAVAEPAADSSAGVWYAAGLRFTCTRCGKCCHDREVPTYVFLEQDDLRRLAEFLDIAIAEVIEHYCDESDDGLVLKARPGTCLFYKSKIGCVVYPARPLQCRTWPFWPSNLRRELWQKAARFCPGCNQGTLHSRGEIEAACLQMLGRRGAGCLWPGEIPLPH